MSHSAQLVNHGADSSAEVRRLGSLRRLRRTFVGLYGLSDLILGLIVPIRVLNLESRELSVRSISTLIAMYVLLSGLMEFPTGGVADTWGRKRSLLLAGVLATVGFGVLGLSGHVLGLALGLVVLALANSLASGPLDAWFIDASAALGEPEQVGALSAAHAASNIGMAVGAGLAVALPLMFDGLPAQGHALIIVLTPIYLAAIAFHLIRLALIWTLIDDPIAPQPRTNSMLAATITTLRRTGHHREQPAARRVLAAIAPTVVVVGMFEVLAPLSLTDDVHIAQPTTIFAIAIAMAFLGAAATAVFAPRLEASMRTPREASALVLGNVVVACAACLFLPRSTGVIATFVTMWIVGGPRRCCTQELHRHVSSAERATAVSASRCFTLGATAGSAATACSATS